MYTLTTFRYVPEFAIGHVRELRVRWALEEAGLPYELRNVDDQNSPEFRQQQPFGQVPVLHDGDFPIFESGAILLHLAEKEPNLLPADPAEREQARMWMFAALNSVEPHTGNLANLLFFHANDAWAKEARPMMEELAKKRLGAMDTWLANRDYLAGSFSAADILMTTVLRQLDDSGVVEQFKNLLAYKQRCMARPAFKKALADHMEHFAAGKAA
jgi:glutathione S-transferase